MQVGSLLSLLNDFGGTMADCVKSTLRVTTGRARAIVTDSVTVSVTDSVTERVCLV